MKSCADVGKGSGLKTLKIKISGIVDVQCSRIENTVAATYSESFLMITSDQRVIWIKLFLCSSV